MTLGASSGHFSLRALKQLSQRLIRDVLSGLHLLEGCRVLSQVFTQGIELGEKAN